MPKILEYPNVKPRVGFIPYNAFILSSLICILSANKFPFEIQISSSCLGIGSPQEYVILLLPAQCKTARDMETDAGTHFYAFTDSAGARRIKIRGEQGVDYSSTMQSSCSSNNVRIIWSVEGNGLEKTHF